MIQYAVAYYNKAAGYNDDGSLTHRRHARGVIHYLDDMGFINFCVKIQRICPSFM